MKSYCSSLDEPADSALTPDNMLAPYREHTPKQLQGKSLVLCLTDGSEFGYAEHFG